MVVGLQGVGQVYLYFFVVQGVVCQCWDIWWGGVWIGEGVCCVDVEGINCCVGGEECQGDGREDSEGVFGWECEWECYVCVVGGD